MTESNQNEIINRLQKLEKQNRYMKLGGLAIVLLVVTTLLTGASTKPEIAEEIRTKKIVVVDELGKEIITMGETNTGSEIALLDYEGKIRLRLGENGRASYLNMYDSEAKKRFKLEASGTGSSLFMYDSKAKERFSLTLMEIGSLLQMRDSKGLQRFEIGSRDNADNGGFLQMYNKTYEDVVQLRVDEYGNGVVGAYNRKGMGKELKPGP